MQEWPVLTRAPAPAVGGLELLCPVDRDGVGTDLGPPPAGIQAQPPAGSAVLGEWFGVGELLSAFLYLILLLSLVFKFQCS